MLKSYLREEMNDDSFLRSLQSVLTNKEQIIEKMKRNESGDALRKLTALIQETAK